MQGYVFSLCPEKPIQKQTFLFESYAPPTETWDSRKPGSFTDHFSFDRWHVNPLLLKTTPCMTSDISISFLNWPAPQAAATSIVKSISNHRPMDHNPWRSDSGSDGRILRYDLVGSRKYLI